MSALMNNNMTITATEDDHDDNNECIIKSATTALVTPSFSPNFYNPFEIKHRRRTSRGQFKILEKAFIDNPKPNAKIRQGLAESLSMTPRGVQVWFQNRRAKAKQQEQQEKEKKNQQHQHYDYSSSEGVIDNLQVASVVVLSSSGMVHSRSQSSISSTSTTYSSSEDNNNNTHVRMKNIPMEGEVIHHHSSALLLTPPHQHDNDNDNDEQQWWNNATMANNHQSHQTSMTNPAVAPVSTTMTNGPFTTANSSAVDQLDAWAYIDSLDINHSFIDSNSKVINNNVEDWLSSTKQAAQHHYQNDDFLNIIDRRHSFQPTFNNTANYYTTATHQHTNFSWTNNN